MKIAVNGVFGRTRLKFATDFSTAERSDSLYHSPRLAW